MEARILLNLPREMISWDGYRLEHQQTVVKDYRIPEAPLQIHLPSQEIVRVEQESVAAAAKTFQGKNQMRSAPV